MHICLLTSSRSFEIVAGGEEKFTLSLGKWLLNQGYDVTIVGRRLFGVEVAKGFVKASPIGPRASEATPRRMQLPYPLFVLTMLFTSLLFVLRVIAVNREQGISIIHAQDTGYGGLSAVVAAKMLRIPVVVTSHGIRYNTIKNALNGISAPLLLPWECWLDNFVSRRASTIIGVSCSVKEFFVNMTRNESRIQTIPIGVEVNRFRATQEARQSVRKEFGIQDEILVGFVGRLAPEKNLATLIEAFAKAVEDADHMKLVLVGMGPLEDKLRMLSHERGLDNKVFFAGIRYDVDRFLSALDIFALPSLTEGCPTSMIEAMAAGRAVIASDIPSIREIVKHDEGAILVKPMNVEGFRQALLSLYGNVDLRAKIGRKAMKTAELYDIETVYPQILKLYENLSSRQKMDS